MKKQSSVNGLVNPFFTERITYLEKTISQMKQFLDDAPKGNLVCRSSGKNVFRYYRNTDEKQLYIPEKAKNNAKLLALKKMYRKVLASAEKELKALIRISGDYGLLEKDIALFLDKNPGCGRLLYDTGYQNNEDLNARISSWIDEEYKCNPFYQDYLIHSTLKGEKVRSKSEASIADVLYMSKIPYRYECELKIGNETFYPDFMILDPETGKIYIWEHFGMIDMDKYLSRSADKIKAYTSAGYFPNNNFIITFEDSEHPFTGVQAVEIVSKYFGRDPFPEK